MIKSNAPQKDIKLAFGIRPSEVTSDHHMAKTSRRHQQFYIFLRRVSLYSFHVGGSCHPSVLFHDFLQKSPTGMSRTKKLYFILDINSERLAGFSLIIRLIKSDANNLPIG